MSHRWSTPTNHEKMTTSEQAEEWCPCMPRSAPPPVRSNRRTHRDVGLKLRARSGPSRTGVLVDMPWQPGRAVEHTRAAVHKKRSARLELRVAQLASADGPRLLGVCERTAHPAAYAVAWRPGAAEGLGTLRISPENDVKGGLSLRLTGSATRRSREVPYL